ncbi:MAG: hypothetical protein HYT80_01885 [Euryarchaeota archaeon]|nr:hypothetical protein [Euryarchaeota archaeon]
MKTFLPRLWGRPLFVPAYLTFSLLVGSVLVLTENPLARLTDEDEYMPLGLQDLLQGRNPYTTGRASDHALDSTCAWHDASRCWYSLPYLPLSILLQVPLLDYRWTALLAFGALGWAVRDRPGAFLALANPGALILAASGFTDLVVVALLAWSIRSKAPILSWLSAGAKQFALPLLILHHGLRKEWTRLAGASAFTLGVILPFLFWDPAAFYYWTVQVHVTGADHKWWGILGIGHANYLLYYAFAATVLYPQWREGAASRLSKQGVPSAAGIELSVGAK